MDSYNRRSHRRSPHRSASPGTYPRQEHGRQTVTRSDRDGRRERRSASPSRRRSVSRTRSRTRERRDVHEHRPRRRSVTASRSRSRSRSRERKRRRSKERSRRRRSRSASSSSSDSDGEARRKKKKEKRRRSSRSLERRERKREKKERKKQKKKKESASGAQWGKYGIINETDQYNKAQEFHAWLVEERMVNPETISKDTTRKEFARFVEDYNTATLPHEKYYNMDSYERRMSAIRAGEYLPPSDGGYDPNADLRALQSQHRRKDTDKESYLSREQLEELRKVQNERVQAGRMKILGMDIKQNMGVRMDGTAFDD